MPFWQNSEFGANLDIHHLHKDFVETTFLNIEKLWVL
jgi:hypothetical protein